MVCLMSVSPQLHSDLQDHPLFCTYNYNKSCAMLTLSWLFLHRFQSCFNKKPGEFVFCLWALCILWCSWETTTYQTIRWWGVSQSVYVVDLNSLHSFQSRIREHVSKFQVSYQIQKTYQHDLFHSITVTNIRQHETAKKKARFEINNKPLNRQADEQLVKVHSTFISS